MTIKQQEGKILLQEMQPNNCKELRMLQWIANRISHEVKVLTHFLQNNKFHNACTQETKKISHCQFLLTIPSVGVNSGKPFNSRRGIMKLMREEINFHEISCKYRQVAENWKKTTLDCKRTKNQ